ncbi:F0F1 ATP synthase subunit delta [Synechococcales cyanobacterium C]|uniref:ATP synthase subunit delta n=1 Tax=Petrachloros mirabilis ULC683 TaxID=2781853 RepID=A0A8K2A9T6_9CYAN|nr:ATP synthase F1 subunit delta [Petrachloros mirabilis]NCJ08530.1 F0F1 ATP synthase subunit delta [Petrachloros mirabilis ULC683]
MKQNAVSAEIVEPYAEALMAVAQSQSLTEAIGQDVQSVLETLGSSTELRDFLVNPFVKGEAKKAVLQQVIGAEVQDSFRKFLMLLVDRRRIFLLEAICKQYQALLRKLNNAVLAEVTSTVALSESQHQAIVQKVQQMTQAAQVELETRLDPDLIGGVIIKVGSQVLDASIRGQLRRISNSLTSA